MPRSIRFRLAAAFALVALVAVGALGGLALGLLRGITQRQEVTALRANAEAVADQALPYLSAPSAKIELDALALTSAFVSDRRVRIFAADGAVVADSGPRPTADQFLVIDPASGWSGAGGPQVILHGEPIPAIPPGFKALRVHQHRGPLGTQFDLSPWVRPLEAVSAEVAVQIGPSSPGRVAFGDDWGGAVTTRPAHASALGSSASLAEEPQSHAVSLRAVRVNVGESSEPIGFVELSGGPDTSARVLATAQQAIGAAAAAATLAAAALGVVFSRSLTAPLAALASTARRLEDGDLHTRSQEGGPDEIAALAGAFNRMAESLERTVSDLESERDTLRRFVADASHQLRTPITALSTYHELLRGPAGDVDADRTAFLEEGAQQLGRLQWITTNLLDLSRLDAGLADLSIEYVPVADLLDAAVSPYRRRAAAQETTLDVVAFSRGLQVACDRARLELAIGNLVDNALKHTAQGDSVTVNAELGDDRTIRLTVRDTGTGIDPADMPRVFDRFYQGSRRMATSGPPGAGLGLAVVRSIVAAHGGSVVATDNPGGGTAVTVSVPQVP